MKLPTSNAQRSTLNAQSACFGRWKLSVERWPFGACPIPHSALRIPHFLRAFTLIELILVMALITIVVSVSLPALKGFFRGRDLDSEARRFLSLTRYAASRAVAEGIPMELYVDAQQKLYGLRAQAGFLESDCRAVQYKLPEELSFEVTAALPKSGSSQTALDDLDLDSPAEPSDSSSSVRIIRFTADGFIGDKSPAAVILRQRPADELAEGDALALAQSATRLHYEIRTLQPTR